MCIPRILGLFAAGCLFLNPAAALAQYKYPRDDLVVIMNGALFNLIDNLTGTSYDAHYHNNGKICKTPFLSGTLSKFADTRLSQYDLINGTEKTTVGLSVWTHFEASHCISSTIKLDVGCNSGLIPLVGPPGVDFQTYLVCAANFNGYFGIALPVPVKIPYPVQVPSTFNVSLPTIPPTSNLSVDLEFAGWDAATSTWKPLAAPYNKDKVWPLSGDLAFLNDAPSNGSNPGNILYQQGKYITGKATATHPRVILSTSSQQTALSEGTGLDSFFQNNPNAMARIRIRDSLIAPQKIGSPTDPRYGLIGGLFPLIVRGTFKAPSPVGTIKFSMVITGVTASISSSGINTGISIEDVSATDSSGKSLPAKLTNSAIAVDLTPTYRNGVVRLQTTKLDAALDVNAAGKSTAIALGATLQKVLNAIAPMVAQVNPKITFGLPQCISVNNPQFQASAPCQDYGGNENGFVSKSAGPASITYSVDFSKTSISLADGEIDIGFQR